MSGLDRRHHAGGVTDCRKIDEEVRNRGRV